MEENSQMGMPRLATHSHMHYMMQGNHFVGLEKSMEPTVSTQERPQANLKVLFIKYGLVSSLGQGAKLQGPLL